MKACAWCRGPIPERARRDAVCCSKRCRQARHRFRSGVGVAPDVGNDVLRLAYADPPYPGLSKRYYGKHPDYAGEVDHRRLIEQLDGYDVSRGSSRRVDVLTYRPGVRSTDPDRVVGAKPAVFCRWMFDLLGAEPQDEFTDLFAGSGGVMRAWRAFAGEEEKETV